jgi:hypothetical protein
LEKIALSGAVVGLTMAILFVVYAKFVAPKIGSLGGAK